MRERQATVCLLLSANVTDALPDGDSGFRVWSVTIGTVWVWLQVSTRVPFWLLVTIEKMITDCRLS